MTPRGNPEGEMVKVAKDRANRSRTYALDGRSGNWEQVGEDEFLTPKDLLDSAERVRYNKEFDEREAAIGNLATQSSALMRADLDALIGQGLPTLKPLIDTALEGPALFGVPWAEAALQSSSEISIGTVTDVLDTAQKLSGPKSDKDIELIKSAVINGTATVAQLAYARRLVASILKNNRDYLAAQRELYARRGEYGSVDSYEKAVFDLKSDPRFFNLEGARLEGVTFDGLNDKTDDETYAKLDVFLKGAGKHLKDDERVFFDGEYKSIPAGELRANMREYLDG